MSFDLGRRVSVALNRTDPQGQSYSIAVEDALSPDDRQACERRLQRLSACLAPAGEQAAAVALGSMRLMMLDAGRSEQETDKILELWVENLADLPPFAIQAATTDFLRGDAGERGFVPKLPIFRQHAATKVVPYADDKARLVKLIEAHRNIRPPRASDDLRKRTADAAKARLQPMREAGERADRERRGLAWTPPQQRRSPEEDLQLLKADRDKPIAPLSPDLAARFRVPDFSDEEMRNG